jgi:uncharacterized protein DUF4432
MRSICLTVLLCLLGWNVAGADEFVQPLISAQRGINVETWQITSSEVTPDCPVHWALHKYALHGGKQEGVDLIVVNSGKVRITVCPTRGMGVISVTSGDVRLGWDSPVKEVVNPRNINLQMRGGLGWLEGFNEWLVRCGLESAGHPGTDKFINNVGDEATMDLTLHGRIENIPASEVEVMVEKQAPYRIHIRGRVDERAFYGPKLELRTDLITTPGSATFAVDDTITNQGDNEQEFEIIYHTNYGPPLLEEGSTALVAAKRVVPFNANAAKGVGSYRTYAGPTPGFIEQVYCIDPQPDSAGNASAMLVNRKKDRAVKISWAAAELPFFTLWKNTTSLKEGYVTGLEPGTNFAFNRRVERQAGRVQKLKAGASHHSRVEFTVLSTAEQVSDAAKAIEDLQRAHPPQIEQAPPQIEK